MWREKGTGAITPNGAVYVPAQAGRQADWRESPRLILPFYLEPIKIYNFLALLLLSKRGERGGIFEMCLPGRKNAKDLFFFSSSLVGSQPCLASGFSQT